MSTSVIVWLLVIVVGSLVSFANKQMQKAAKAARTDRSSGLAASQAQCDVREFVESNTNDIGIEGTAQAVQSDAALRYTSEDGASLSPEDEGLYRRFYAEAEAEGRLASGYTFAVEEGTSSISASALRASGLYNADERAKKSSQPFLLPNGTPFNLATAMYYDLIFHRRSEGLLGQRRGVFRK